MHIVQTRNVEDALITGVKLIKSQGVQRDSRNGPVMRMPMPLTTVYDKPKERVLFNADRDANPFFHFMECLWMMAGRNDVEWISRFNSGMANYSDNGTTFHGAYGYRWRNAESLISDGEFDENFTLGSIDQLATIAKLLQENPDDRRTVLTMWNADQDLGHEGKDFPCNLTITFSVNPSGELDMTVFNRSNDMVWGAYGANAVHMSFLQEVMAAWIGKPVGRYWQISTNFHAYLKTLEQVDSLESLATGFSAYETGEVQPFPVVNTAIETWMAELEMFMSEGAVMGYTDPFFKQVAIPMLQSWERWKNREISGYRDAAIEKANLIAAPDWRKACIEWLERRA